MLVQYEPWVYNGNLSKEGEPEEIKDLWGVKIQEGRYLDTVISLNSIEFTDEKDNDGNNLQIDYTIISVPKEITKEDCACVEFEQILQYIIVDIINKATRLYEDRNSSTTESDT